MKFLAWNSCMQTGIAEVDGQHAGLIEVINEFAPSLATTGQGTIEGMQALHQRLNDYAREHFRTEEELMLRHGVDSRVYDHHHQAHVAFIQQLGGLERKALVGEAGAGDELLAFLAGWLLTHILGEDQTLARQVRAIGKGMSPEQAYREAGGYRVAPANEAVTAVLVDLYKRMLHEPPGEPAGLEPPEHGGPPAASAGQPAGGGDK